MSARALLLGAIILLLATWALTGSGWLRRASEWVRLIVAALFIFFAVRVGLSIAILAFDLAPISWTIPVAFGIAAWLLRPGRRSRKTP